MTREKIYLFFVILITFGIYLGTLNYSFTYEDPHYIGESEYIKGIKPLISIFKGDAFLRYENIDLSRPFMPVSLALDYKAWGLNPAGYRLTNIILHILNSILVYTLAVRVLSGWGPLMASLLFALHPIHIEPVVGVTFREDLLVTFFYLSSLLLYMRFTEDPNKRYYFLSVFSFLLALFSKEMAVTLPVILLIYDFSLSGKRGKRLLYHLPYWGFLLFYLYVIYYAYSNLPYPPTHVSGIISIISTPLKMLAIYLKLMLFPFSLHVDYNVPLSTAFRGWEVIASIALILVISTYLIRSRDKTAFFYLAFFFVTLLPVLNIVPTFRLMADRFLYLPSVGFCIAFPLLISRFENRLSGVSQIRKVFFFASLCVAVLFAAAAVKHQRVWKDDLSLWSDVLKKSPLSVRAYTALGTYYLNLGKDDEAFPMLRKAIELKPDYDKAHYNLGVVYLRKGHLDAAILSFNKAIEYNPAYAKARFNLGLSYAKKGLYDKAIQEYEEALKLTPGNAVLYNNIGNVYGAKGMHDRAIAMYERAVLLDLSYSGAYYNMGNSFAERGRYGEALSFYEKAIALDPTNPSAYFNMGNVHLYLGQREKAVDAYNEALRLDPMHEGAMDALRLMMRGDK